MWVWENDNRVAVEFYVGSHVLCGYLYIARGRRLLDILNSVGDLDRDVQSDYIEFACDAGQTANEAEEVRYVRKKAVELAALSDADLARGAGAKASPGTHPRIEKSPVRVTLELPGHVLDCNIHCAPGRTIRDVLDEDRLFLPLTEVTIVRENRVYSTRPFVAARKDQIISLRQEIVLRASGPWGRE